MDRYKYYKKLRNEYLDITKMIPIGHNTIEPSHFSQIGGERGVVNMNKKKFTGSGIILVEEFTNKRGRREPAVILFRNIRMNMYGDLGGYLDYEDTLEKYPLAEGSIREAYEESRGLVDITDAKHIIKKIGNINPYIDTKQYRCHFVGIKSGLLYNSDFKKNMRLLDAARVSRSYKETNDVARFYVSDLVKSGVLTARGDFNTVDAYGNKTKVTGRARALVREAIKAGLINLVVYNPVRFKMSSTVIKNTRVKTLKTY